MKFNEIKEGDEVSCSVLAKGFGEDCVYCKKRLLCEQRTEIRMVLALEEAKRRELKEVN